MPKRTPDEGEIRLCWRHNVRLYAVAFGSLLDLTGRMYLRRATPIMLDARHCPNCHHPNGAR